MLIRKSRFKEWLFFRKLKTLFLKEEYSEKMTKNIFLLSDVNEVITRIQRLNADSQPLWGKMAVGQMLAHCNVTYEMVYENIHPKPNFILKLILKMLVKKTVVNEVPYKHNSNTAPQFIIKDSKEFEKERLRLVNYIYKTQELGESYFDGKESLSFGELTKSEWNNMFYKHLDHHLRQFGV
jgi:hypothetical protein